MRTPLSRRRRSITPLRLSRRPPLRSHRPTMQQTSRPRSRPTRPRTSTSTRCGSLILCLGQTRPCPTGRARRRTPGTVAEEGEAHRACTASTWEASPTEEEAVKKRTTRQAGTRVREVSGGATRVRTEGEGGTSSSCSTRTSNTVNLTNSSTSNSSINLTISNNINISINPRPTNNPRSTTATRTTPPRRACSATHPTSALRARRDRTHRCRRSHKERLLVRRTRR